MTSSRLKKFADVQEGPRHGHFTLSVSGLKHYVHGEGEEQPLDERGKWTTSGKGASNPTGPTPGQRFIVYRMGGKHEVSLKGRNAGNAEGVANFIESQTADYDGPSTGNAEHDPHVHAYEVTVQHPFGSYSMSNRGERVSGVTVGRQAQGWTMDPAQAKIQEEKGEHLKGKTIGAEVIYSFPTGGFTERHLGAIPLKQVARFLPRDEFGPSFGQVSGAKAIRKAFGHSPGWEPGEAR